MRVHQRLRVHDHLDPVVGQVEQVVRLDHLEPLVHHRRRVDRDLGPHAPGGMAQRVLARDPLQFIGRSAAKRTPDAVSTAAVTRSGGAPSSSWKSAECSESTGTRAAPVRARTAATRSPPATRLSLLARATVIPRSRAASVGRSPAAPDQRVQHDVGARWRRSAPPGRGRTGPCRRRPSRRGVGDAARGGLGGHLVGAPPAGEPAGGEVGGAVDDVECLDADRARGAQNEYACHRSSVARTPSAPW